MNHFDISEQIIATCPNSGDGYALNMRTGQIGPLIFRACDVEAEWLNLLRSAPMLYKALSAQYSNMQKLIEALERGNSNPALVTALVKMQDALLLSQRVALEGIDAVSEAVDRESKTN